MAAPYRLLYIDDDAGLGRLVQRTFERDGFAVTLAANAADGLEALKAGAFDAVALDHHMPVQNGLDVLPDLVALPDAPPVVYVTGESEGRVAVAALKAGAVDYVIKEVSGEFLPLLRAAVLAAIAARADQRARQTAEAELRLQRDRFAALAEERAMLLQEVSHRVGNSLQIVTSLLSMQASASPSAEVKAALTGAVGRVKAVTQVHRRLYASYDVKVIALDSYLEMLAADLAQTAGSGANISVTADEIQMSPDQAVSIGIIVAELVINALKYAYADGRGDIRIACRDKGDEILLSVEDDGRGMGDGGGHGGLGQKVITTLARRFNASVTIDPAHKGARVMVNIPKSGIAPPG